jgi:GTP-binding protein LepA
VITDIRVMDGTVKKGDKIRMMASGSEFEVTEVGVFTPTMKPVQQLSAGDVGYLAASIKEVRLAQVGDTITEADRPTDQALPGYKKATSMVFCGIYPAEGEDYNNVRDALEKLQVNDAALTFEPETSVALGFGFRCGFLGLLHLEIIQERLEREFDLSLVTTAPSVIYRITTTDGETMEIQNPTNFPDPTVIETMEEPIVEVNIMSPTDFVGPIMELCQARRAIFKNMEYMEETRVMIHYDMPLNEVIYDFFDALKSRTKGYASMDYELKGYQVSKLVKLDMLINGELVDAFSIIVHEDTAYQRARQIAERLKDVIPRHQFAVPIQASIGSKIIARETIRALRKDVLAKCYGGDISRKKKLLEKQKQGKKRMRQVGSVSVPQEAFLAVLKFDSSKK